MSDDEQSLLAEDKERVSYFSRFLFFFLIYNIFDFISVVFIKLFYRECLYYLYSNKCSIYILGTNTRGIETYEF